MAEKEYIEREAAYKACEAYFSGVCVYDVSASEVINDFENVIDAVPTADVVPIRHGRWISLDDYFEDAQCSECGDALVIGDCSFNDFCECYNYCPNCGAKMDGGEEND